MPGLEFTSWYGIWGPKALPAPIVGRLNEALAEILRGPALRERAAALGFEPTHAGQDEFRRFIAARCRTQWRPPPERELPARVRRVLGCVPRGRRRLPASSADGRSAGAVSSCSPCMCLARPFRSRFGEKKNAQDFAGHHRGGRRCVARPRDGGGAAGPDGPHRRLLPGVLRLHAADQPARRPGVTPQGTAEPGERGRRRRRRHRRLRRGAEQRHHRLVRRSRPASASTTSRPTPRSTSSSTARPPTA